MYLLKNDRGSIEILFIFFISIIFLIFTLVLGHIKLFHKYRKEIYLNALCAQEISQITPLYIEKMEKINKLIKLIKVSKLILIPSAWGLGSKITTKSAIKILKLQQFNLQFSYLKKLNDYRQKKCHFSLNTFKTPYVSKGIFLERNKYEETILRSHFWQIKINSALLSFHLFWTKTSPRLMKIQLIKHRMVLLSHFL